jgi:hypothetical protein
VYTVNHYSVTYGIMEAIGATRRINSLTRINNEPPWKDQRTMYTPLYVLDAHIEAVNTKRLQQVRQAELMRLARQGQQGLLQRIIARLRRSSGTTLVSVGQWLQRTPADRVAQELEAMGVTRSQASSSYR